MGITELYSNKYNYLLKLEEEYFDNFNSTILQPLVNSNILSDTVNISAKPINLLELSMNHKFKTAIKTNIYNMNLVMSIYVNIEEEIVTIINQIDSEIKSQTD